MTIRWNCEKQGCYKNALPDWSIFDGCFPRRVEMSDIDGMVEIGGRFLIIEWKAARGTEIKNGQRRMLQRFGQPPDAAIIVRGQPDDMEWLCFDGSDLDGFKPVTLEELRKYVRSWAADAERNPWP